MPELNLKQIIDKLNAEFTGETRKLVFWYDDKAEFIEDIETMELVNARIYRLEKDNQFYTKYFLERLDQKNNYLIYAPFPKPSARDNHLEDTLLYSRQFFVDRASFICADLGIRGEKEKQTIAQYIRFFGAKERTQRFYDLEMENFTEETIEVAMMSVLCKTKTASFEEVVRVILTDDELEDSKFLAEFDRYDLLPAFWHLCEAQFGYTDVKPSLQKLVFTLFVTYTERYLRGDLPKPWVHFKSYKAGSIITFLDSLMNNVLYREKYDQLSTYAARELNAASAFENFAPEALIDCDTFAIINRYIIQWVIERLLNEDIGAKLGDMTISAVCQERCRKHFGENFRNQYLLLENALKVISAAKYHCRDSIKAIAEQYLAADSRIDSHYRRFYYIYDQLDEYSPFEQLRDLVENIYTNEYLNKVIAGWNSKITSEAFKKAIPFQRSFYQKFVQPSKDRVVVIISDAMRYEVGHSLFLKLQDDEKCTVKLDAMLSVLPSYTKLGMAALMPHKTLEMTDDYKVLANGLPCDDMKQREALLKNYSSNSRCVQFDEIKTMGGMQLREIFTGMDVVYVYHNQIDARGDKQNTENEVFTACEEAIDEIFAFIKRVSTRANTYHFIITADHGFIYKRSKLTESDKISNVAEKNDYMNRRFIISEHSLQSTGIVSLPLNAVLDNNKKWVSFPVSSNVFKMPGGGQNYVHGGSSPQEMIVPVIDVKTEKGHMETRPAKIVLVSMFQKITNLIASLDFLQTEPVSDIVKATSYKVFFISDQNEKISNENLYFADKKEPDPQKRIFRLRFNFKNKQYDKLRRYYLVAYDEKNDMEILRHEVIMDIAFSNDFGFNV